MSSNPKPENEKVRQRDEISETVHDPVCGMVVDPQADLTEFRVRRLHEDVAQGTVRPRRFPDSRAKSNGKQLLQTARRAG